MQKCQKGAVVTDIIGLVGDMFGGKPLMVSKKVKDFIEKNKPKEIVVDMETVSKIDNVEVYTNSTKQKIEIVVKKARTNKIRFLQPNEGLVALDKGEHIEYYKQHLPLKLFFTRARLILMWKFVVLCLNHG